MLIDMMPRLFNYSGKLLLGAVLIFSACDGDWPTDPAPDPARPAVNLNNGAAFCPKDLRPAAAGLLAPDC